MRVIDAPKFAVEYLRAASPIEYPGTPGDWRLHGKLQYQLVRAVERIESQFGEITRRDVVTLVEAWIVTQGTLRAHRPLQPREGVGEDH